MELTLLEKSDIEAGWNLAKPMIIDLNLLVILIIYMLVFALFYNLIKHLLARLLVNKKLHMVSIPKQL